MDKQTGKLIARIAENLPDMERALMQKWIDNPKGLKTVLQKALCPPEPDTLTSAPEVKFDSIIRVDRSTRPSYPDWMKEVMHPELESVGPAEYDISTVERWLYGGQKDGKGIRGNRIYEHLKKTDTLKTCLGLRDLEEIQKKSIAFFRKHFKGKVVFGWAGIVQFRSGNLRVPCLYENGDEVILYWRWTDEDWSDSDSALRLASSTKA